MDLLPIPTAQELRDRWNSDVVSKFPTAKPQNRFSFFGITGKAHALLLHGQYLFTQNIAKQIFVTTATGIFLDFHGSDFGVTRRPATAASGDVVLTGTNGSVIAIGTRIKSKGILYETQSVATITGGTATVEIESITFGLATQRDPAETMNFVTTPVGLDNPVTVSAGGLTGGFDRETDEEYRQRVLFRKRNPLQGSAPSDYLQLMLEVPGVTRPFVFPKEAGLCTVTNRFMTDNSTGNGIPTAGDVAAVLAFLESEIGAGVDIFVFAPVAAPVAYDVTIDPDNQGVRDAVEQSLRDLHLREAEPGKLFPISKIRAAVSNAAGEDDNTVNSPAADIPAGGAGDIPTFGTIVFT